MPEKRGVALRRSKREREEREGDLRSRLRKARREHAPAPERRKLRKATMSAHRRTVFATKRLANYRALLRERRRDPGKQVLRAAGQMLGKTEAGYNDAPWLRVMEADILRAGGNLGWMIPGQPYCGFGCIWSWLEGVGLKLPDGTVYTPNIPGYAGMRLTAKDGRKFKLVGAAPEQAKPGALVVMDFTPGTGADHVALARGPMRGGLIPCREFNTSSGNSGSQANGGGVYDRVRPRAFVLAVINIVPA